MRDFAQELEKLSKKEIKEIKVTKAEYPEFWSVWQNSPLRSEIKGMAFKGGDIIYKYIPSK